MFSKLADKMKIEMGGTPSCKFKNCSKEATQFLELGMIMEFYCEEHAKFYTKEMSDFSLTWSDPCFFQMM